MHKQCIQHLEAVLMGVILLTAQSTGMAFEGDQSTIPKGEYRLDSAHSTLVFKVSHLGFSFYTATFPQFDVDLNLDPKDLTSANLTATIDVNSLQLSSPPDGFLKELLGGQWLNGEKYPTMTYRSTQVEKVGDNEARMIGDLTLNGKTHPVAMDVRFNGGYPGMANLDPQARIGFSAKGSLKRSDFGITVGIPTPGSNLGVGDDVEFVLETEFTGPPLDSASTSKLR